MHQRHSKRFGWLIGTAELFRILLLKLIPLGQLRYSYPLIALLKASYVLKNENFGLIREAINRLMYRC